MLFIIISRAHRRVVSAVKQIDLFELWGFECVDASFTEKCNGMHTNTVS